jgi:hypothetical protein
MGSRGDAYDNAACDTRISTLKVEWINRHRYTNRDQARLSIFRHIETFYNPRRRHSALGGISPDEYERRCLNRQAKERIDTIQTTRAAQIRGERKRGKLTSLGSRARAAAPARAARGLSADGRVCAAGMSTSCAPARDASATASLVLPRIRAGAGAGAVEQARR